MRGYQYYKNNLMAKPIPIKNQNCAPDIYFLPPEKKKAEANNFSGESLEKEYFHIQSTIESFDAKSLTIKAWSVSVAGLVASSGAFSGKWDLLLFAAGLSFLFWLVDTAWKTFQYAHYGRIHVIERFMRGEQDDQSDLANLQISRTWFDDFKKGGAKRYLTIMCRMHVVLPHGAMFFALLIAYIITK